MDSELQRRRELATRILRSLRHESAQKALRAVNGDGERPVVVALEEDRVSEVTQRVEEYGGAANVVYPSGQYLVVVGFHRQTEEEQTEDTCDVHQDITMGMLAEYLMQRPEGRATCRVHTPGGLIEVAEGQEKVMVPA